MELNQAVGQTLRKFRLISKVSQEQIGASQSYVSDVERGIKAISIEKLDEFAKILGVHPVTILVSSYLLADETLTPERLIDRIQRELGA